MQKQSLGEFIGKVLPTFASKVIAFALGAMAIYQFLCDQFGFPTLPTAWQVTGGHIPWWGWLIIALLLFQLALIDYLRRLTTGMSDPGAAAAAAPAVQPDLEIQPDLKMVHLLPRVMSLLQLKKPVDDDSEVSGKVVAREILDKVKHRGMHVWGRSGEKALEAISDFEWSNAGLVWADMSLRVTGGMQAYYYTDLHFSENEVDAVWPAI